MSITPLSAVVAQHSTRWPAPNADALIGHYDELRLQAMRITHAREDLLAVAKLATVPGVLTHMTTAVRDCDAALVIVNRRMAQIDVRLAELGADNPFRS